MQPRIELSRFEAPIAVTIRLCRAEDLDGLEWMGAYRRDRAVIEEAFRRQLVGTNAMLVAEAGAFPVGQVWVDLEKRRAQRIGVLWALRVMPGLWRAGIGRTLVSDAERLLAARGYAQAEVAVERENERVIGFYEGLGYRSVRREREAYRHEADDGSTVEGVFDGVLLRKALRPERAAR